MDYTDRLQKLEEEYDLVEKKKKPYSSMTITAGDPAYNIKVFNKHFGTDGLPNGGVSGKTVMQGDTFLAKSPDGSNSVECSNGDSAAGGEAGAACCEDISLEEERKVRRYYIKPHNEFCANKAQVLQALVDHEETDCIIYTLNNQGDTKDVGKLTDNDIIYYYQDGILYDKNHVRIMDYDLSIKHEEEREKINPNTVSDARFADVYADRIADVSVEEEYFNLDFPALTEAKEKQVCCICGEEIKGYGNNPEPYHSAENGERCCDACNLKFVIPARLEGIQNEDK